MRYELRSSPTSRSVEVSPLVWDSQAEEAARQKREQEKSDRSLRQRLSQSRLARRLPRNDKGQFVKG
jgi:hypothetical protein